MNSAEPETRPWVLTGMSGAGKTTALRALEAAGISCVDNLPVAMLAAFIAEPRSEPAVAVVDSRSGEQLAGLDGAGGAQVVFLDAPDAVLVRRLADSTRPHPCAAAGGGQAAVTAERAMVTPLRAAADVVIDTGALTEAELSERILDVVAAERASTSALRCTVSSFGFKYGPQIEADWVIDSRILPNPFWEPALRPLTGLDQPVRDFLLGQEVSREFIEKTAAVLEWVVAVARRRGRQAIHVAVGCTGGRHRSVVIAVELAARLAADGVTVGVRHRDLHRPDPR
ncbi:MAG TPA: RNase adapter RapZ [Candidatus Dormibacteraeota bacterium]